MSGTKEKRLYLSDRPPLTAVKVVMLAISYVLLFFYVFVILWPLSQILFASFNGNHGSYLQIGVSFSFSLKHFEYLFGETYFLNWVVNTILIALATALLTLFFVSFTGYAYSRYRFKGRKASLMAIMLIQTIPSFAGIAAFYTLHSIIVSIAPWFSRQMFLILIYAGGGIAGNTFILKGYIDSISRELDDAARIDGCGNLQVYRLIIMPIVRPMLAVIALWSFIGPFLDFMLPSILLNDPKSYTLATGLHTLINDVRNMHQPVFAAGGLLTAVPIIVLFIALQKQLVSGLASGAVKG
ncbi:MAG TPA: sugar ABC transporter permease [Bacillota bacterium]|jgi:arabinogalactan oligomer/maltooligosaccharide transport system permease protein|nr:sugar ABC transporter permease [Fastidiosipila sp.]HPX93572.1 sugar ABC transporter permease [Bacillota bacterium]HQB80547.1 sugar ABC transporter permease [Bacillota bacterium]